MNEPTLVFLCPLDIANTIKQCADEQEYISYVSSTNIGRRWTGNDWHGVKVYTGKDRSADTILILKFNEWYQFTADNFHYAFGRQNKDKWTHECMVYRCRF